MDWLQFFASTIGSLAWPVSAVTVVLLLRRAITRLLPSLRRLKYGGAEAEFGEVLEEAEEDTAELPTPSEASDAAKRVDGRIKDVGDFSNNSAVFIAWLKVESAILNLARAKNLLLPNMTALRAADVLLNDRLIDRALYEAIRDLSRLRNIAVHPTDARLITSAEVARFSALADKVAAALESGI